MTTQQSDYLAKLFISYSHKDEAHRSSLVSWLSSPEMKGLLEVWSDESIMPGQGITPEIRQKLSGADIIVFLLSRDFLSSPPCIEEWELAQRFATTSKDLFRVPIIVRTCRWKAHVGDLKALPKDGKPVNSFDDEDVAWDQVYEGLKTIAQEVRAARQKSIPNIVDWFSSLTGRDHLVFVYGSLLDPDDLARSINQDPSTIEYVPALLANHVTAWGAPSRRLNYCSPKWKSLDDKTWLWLVLRRTGNEGDVIPGALIKLRDRQFQQVRSRESHYNETIVTDDIWLNDHRVNDLHGLLPTEIVTFAPDPLRLPDVQTAAQYKVRAGYYDAINRYLPRFHPNRAAGLPELPRGTDMLEGFPTDDHVVDTFWSTIPEERLHSYWSELEEELDSRGVVRGREVIPFVPRPLVLNRHTYREVLAAAEAAVSLMAKTQHIALKDRRLFNLHGYTQTDRDLSDEELANNHMDLPIVSRVDMALRGDQITIFEVNADSPAGMYHLDQLTELQWGYIEKRELTGDLADFLQPVGCSRVCDAIVDAFYRNWKQYQTRAAASVGNREMSRIAIVDIDISTQGALSEFHHLQELLAQKGAAVDILDISDLRYRHEQKRLVDKAGRTIDAVYKRLLWHDATSAGMGDLDDPLCQAYLDNAVFVMNSFRARTIGSKLNFAVVKSPSFDVLCHESGIELNPNEVNTLGKYIPETILWGQRSLDGRPTTELHDSVLNNISDWVAKTFHGKGGDDFIDGAPPDGNAGRFRNALLDGNKGYIAQRRQEHGSVKIPQTDDEQHGEGHMGSEPVHTGCLCDRRQGSGNRGKDRRKGPD